ncbi:MAG: hypothetical protein N4A54_13365 [Peptostreptococcaceae bacterium]|jgi:hypothetical protein|nr:hypothetical protein [Peptostreptococcaceae bacterium]
MDFTFAFQILNTVILIAIPIILIKYISKSLKERKMQIQQLDKVANDVSRMTLELQKLNNKIKSE